MNNRTRTYNATLRITRSQERSPWRRYFLLVPLLFAWFGFSSIMRAVDPPPDGGYANENTAEGDFALFSLRPVPTTQLLAMVRSSGTPPVPSTRLAALLRSNPTPLAAITRPPLINLSTAT